MNKNENKKENIFSKIGGAIKEFFTVKIKEFFVGKEEEKEVAVTIFDDGAFEKGLSYDETRYYSKILHANDTKAYDKTQNGLCLIVLGSISLIVGILFIFLSMQRRMNVIIGINVASVQFVICIICLLIAVVLLSTGIPRFVGAHNRRKKYHTWIQKLGNAKKKEN